MPEHPGGARLWLARPDGPADRSGHHPAQRYPHLRDRAGQPGAGAQTVSVSLAVSVTITQPVTNPEQEPLGNGQRALHSRRFVALLGAEDLVGAGRDVVDVELLRVAGRNKITGGEPVVGAVLDRQVVRLVA